MEHESSSFAPFIFHAVNLIILVGLFVYFYLKKGRVAVADAIAKAEAEMLQAEEELRKARAELEIHQKEHSALPARTADLHKSSREAAEREAARVLESGRVTADYLVAEARQHGEYLSQQAVDQVFREVADALVEGTRKRLGPALTPEAQSRLDGFFLRQLPKQAGQAWTL
ncbi:MAG: hypothetical protein HYT87_12480 [Nitrospirae bacterium]|nr:hypothetical protein [Nitrospirota bacterium]